MAGCKVFPRAVVYVDYFLGLFVLTSFQSRSENIWADAMDLSLELIKEQHSSVSLVYAKYFLRQRCVWTIFRIFVFGQNSKHRVKTFEQTLWILHCNLSKDNTLQFREWIQSISLGSAACGFFGGKLFTCPFSKTEWKPSSRRFGTLIGTPQSTTFINFVDECMQRNFQFLYCFIYWCSVVVFTVKF